MNKWALTLAFALAACSGHTITTAPSAPARAELHQVPAFAPMRTTAIDAVAAANQFVQAQHAILGVDGHSAFTTLRQEITADGNDHVRLQQMYDGVKVWGSDIVVHSDGTNITGVDGHLLGSLSAIDLAPSLADTTAATIAKSDYLRAARDA